MKTKLTIILLFTIFLTSCSSATPAPTATPVDIAALQTAAVESVFQQLTLTAASFTPTPQPTPVLPTETPVPPTAAPALPTSTATERICDNMQFIGDVTVPDGTQIAAGQEFIKTWKVKNTGSCSWTTGYSVLFAYGSQEIRIQPTYLSGEVPTGQEVEISVKLKAPEKAGNYNGTFRLQSNNNIPFGEYFTVVITVP